MIFEYKGELFNTDFIVAVEIVNMEEASPYVIRFSTGINKRIDLSFYNRIKNAISMNKPEIRNWEGMKIIRVSDIGGFGKWLHGQTLPLVEDDETPTDWAYYWDYERYINGLPVID